MPLTILTIKRELLCNYSKTLKGRYLMRHSGTFKKYVKIPILDINTFFQILPYIQSAVILVSQGLTSSYDVIYYILKLILEISILK